MGKFFKGWRRKAGCIALIVACIGSGIWLRSHVVKDDFLFGDGIASGPEEIHYVSSTVAGVMWARESVPEGGLVGYPAGWNAYHYKSKRPSDVFGGIEPTRFEWRWRACGFDFGLLHAQHAGEPDSVESYWIVPYWALIWPPLSLSAYLLIWKPRSLSQ